MKKFFVAGVLALGLALSGCGVNNGYARSGGYTDHDWDLNYSTPYNNTTYCYAHPNGVYHPAANGTFYCSYKGYANTRPSKRPVVIIPPKSKQAAPKSSSGGGWFSKKDSSTSNKSNTNKSSGSTYKSGSSKSSSSGGFKSSSSGGSKSSGYKK